MEAARGLTALTCGGAERGPGVELERSQLDLEIKNDTRKPEKIRKMIETLYDKEDKNFPTFTLFSRAKTKKATPKNTSGKRKQKSATTGGAGKKRKKQ